MMTVMFGGLQLLRKLGLRDDNLEVLWGTGLRRIPGK